MKMSSSRKRFMHILATLGLILIGIVAFILLTANKPQLKKTQPPTPLPMVRTITVETGTRYVPIKGEGTVRPLREIQLVPQVNGKIVFISPGLIDGGIFRKGELLLRIEQEDYQLAVTLAQARVKDSESALKIAQEEAAAAREEWALLSKEEAENNATPPPLVAKEPQLAAARAKLKAEQADLRRALLNLERTELKAPFNGRCSEENIDIGQYVSTGQALATLFSTEAAEIMVPLEDESLYWFSVPGFTTADKPGSPATVHTRFAGQDMSWSGQVVRAEGKLDERTRMVSIVVRVENPYGTRPPLASGMFVTIEIQGRRVENATIIPRPALRHNNIVWVVDRQGILRFRPVKVARRLPNQVIIESGLEQGELIVTSALNAVTDGMQVRINAAQEENIS